MSDKARRTLWDGIKKSVKKPFVKKWKSRAPEGPRDPGKKLMITASITVETCKSTVLLKDACHISASCLPGPAIMPRGLGWWILPYMG